MLGAAPRFRWRRDHEGISSEANWSSCRHTHGVSEPQSTALSLSDPSTFVRFHYVAPEGVSLDDASCLCNQDRSWHSGLASTAASAAPPAASNGEPFRSAIMARFGSSGCCCSNRLSIRRNKEEEEEEEEAPVLPNPNSDASFCSSRFSSRKAMAL